MSGPSHAQSRAETFSAAAAYLKTAASSATSGAGHFELVSDDPAAGGIQSFTAIKRIPVGWRKNSEAPKGGRSYDDQSGNSPAQQ